MIVSAFRDSKEKPNERLVAKVLGDNIMSWIDLKSYIMEVYRNVTEEWRFGNDVGWTLAVRSDRRIILRLIPIKGYYAANFVFNEKTVKAVKAVHLPQPVKKLIANADYYGNECSFTIEAKSFEDMKAILKLIDIDCKSDHDDL